MKYKEMSKESIFKKLRLHQYVYSLSHNKIMQVECVRFLKDGIVWLRDSYKTYPHTIKDLELKHPK